MKRCAILFAAIAGGGTWVLVMGSGPGIQTDHEWGQRQWGTLGAVGGGAFCEQGDSRERRRNRRDCGLAGLADLKKHRGALQHEKSSGPDLGMRSDHRSVHQSATTNGVGTTEDNAGGLTLGLRAGRAHRRDWRDCWQMCQSGPHRNHSELHREHEPDDGPGASSSCRECTARSSGTRTGGIPRSGGGPTNIRGTATHT